MSRVGNRCLCILSLHGKYESIAFPDALSIVRCINLGGKGFTPLDTEAVAPDRIDMGSRTAYHSYLALALSR